MDRRQLKTRKAIFQAFERLLVTKNYSHITVQDIIDEADVGRTTFYAHFETKDSLLQEMCTELFEHIFSQQQDAEHGHHFALSSGDAHIAIAHILCHLQEHGANISRLLMGENGTVFSRYFNSYLDELMNRYVLINIEQIACPVPQDFLHNHITRSFINMVQWWIERGMKEDPEQLAGYYLAVINPLLKQPTAK